MHQNQLLITLWHCGACQILVLYLHVYLKLQHLSLLELSAAQTMAALCIAPWGCPCSPAAWPLSPRLSQLPAHQDRQCALPLVRSLMIRITNKPSKQNEACSNEALNANINICPSPSIYLQDNNHAWSRTKGSWMLFLPTLEEWVQKTN